MTGDIGQSLSQRRQQVGGDRFADRVDGALEANVWLEPEDELLLGDDAQDLEPGFIFIARDRLQAQDRRSDISDRVVEIVDDTLRSTCLTSVGGPRPHCLDRHPRREQLLDDDVVQVTGDTFPVLHHPKVLFCPAQPFLRLESLPNVTNDLDVAPWMTCRPRPPATSPRPARRSCRGGDARNVVDETEFARATGQSPEADDERWLPRVCTTSRPHRTHASSSAHPNARRSSPTRPHRPRLAASLDSS